MNTLTITDNARIADEARYQDGLEIHIVDSCDWNALREQFIAAAKDDVSKRASFDLRSTVASEMYLYADESKGLIVRLMQFISDCALAGDNEANQIIECMADAYIEVQKQQHF